MRILANEPGICAGLIASKALSARNRMIGEDYPLSVGSDCNVGRRLARLCTGVLLTGHALKLRLILAAHRLDPGPARSEVERPSADPSSIRKRCEAQRENSS